MKEIMEGSKEGKVVVWKPQINFIPSNFDKDEWLGKQKLYGFKKFNMDYCVDLMSNMYTIPMYNKSLREEIKRGNRPFYSLNSTILYSRNKEYPKYIKLLVDTGVFECNSSYEVGKKSKGYRFTPEYSSSTCKIYYNCRFGHIEKGNIEGSLIKQEVEYNATVNSLINYLKCAELDFETSISNLKSDYANELITTAEYNTTYCSLEKIKCGDFFATQDEYGRLHTNFTNLKKEYRNFLTANAEMLVSLDLKNAQPFFSTMLTRTSFWESSIVNQISLKNLNENIINQIEDIDTIIMFTKSVEDNVDLLNYNNLVLSGNFYEYFLANLIEAGLKCSSREDAKTSIFEIFFSKTSSLDTNRKAKVFKELFPTIYELFRLIKMSEHNTLALMLQCIESKVIIDGVAENFIVKNPQTPIFTIHDSIVVPIKDFELTIIDMRNIIIDKTGCEPKISKELFTKDY